MKKASENNPWIVFGGWGFQPRLLEPVFGGDAHYVDTVSLIPSLVAGGNLRSDWISRLASWADDCLPRPPRRVAGWSTGSLVATALSLGGTVSRMVLLSATARFCSGDARAPGQPPAVVRTMLRKMRRDPARVLREFRALCEPPEPSTRLREQPPDELADGLRFLEQADLLPVLEDAVPAEVFHGENDKVIPAAAGRMVAERTKGRFMSMPGGHLFFLSSGPAIAATIRHPEASARQS